MGTKLKSRRYKKKRVVSSKKRRQPKSRTKRYRRKTRKTRGGVKRTSVPSELNGPPDAPRKNRRTGPVDFFGEVNQVQPLVQPQVQQGNNLFAYGAPVTPPPAAAIIANNPQTPVFTPTQAAQPQTPIQQGNNLFAEGELTPQGNLNNAFNQAYMESITTPQTMGVPSDLKIEPFGYDEHHNEIVDDYEPMDIADEYYETEEEEED
jgi:hypothetical protein